MKDSFYSYLSEVVDISAFLFVVFVFYYAGSTPVANVFFCYICSSTLFLR